MDASKCRRSLFATFGAAAAFAVTVVLTSCGTSPPIGKPVPVSAGNDLLASARTLLVHEGLPHQAHEKELLARELQRSDVTRIADYPFYTPAVAARQPDALRRVLSDPASFRIYGGPKTCGGFHPDYAVSWTAGGTNHHVLICYGCGEALFVSGSGSLAYNIRDRALTELKTALAPHARKRPR